MWPYPWTHVGAPSHLGHMDRVAATMPSQAHARAAQEAPDIGQWEGQDVPLVRPSSCNVKGGIPSSRRYLPYPPVPDQPMESVAMDVFSMPEVHIGKETLDCVVLCMDRRSGYVVAIPARKRGLLPKEVAVMMICHWHTVFDIPRTIFSDRGPQFTGGWFKAMCSLMGIRHAKRLPISAGPTAGLKWLEDSCSRSYARFTSPTHVGTGLRRCGLL